MRITQEEGDVGRIPGSNGFCRTARRRQSRRRGARGDVESLCALLGLALHAACIVLAVVAAELMH